MTQPVEHFVDGRPAVACMRCRTVFTPELERTRVTVTLSHTSGPPEDPPPAEPDPEAPAPVPVPTVLAEPNEVAHCCFDCLPYVEAAIELLFDVRRHPELAAQPATESERRLLTSIAAVDSSVWASSLLQQWVPARSMAGVARTVLALRGIEAPEVPAEVPNDPRHPGSLEAQLLKVSHPRP